MRNTLITLLCLLLPYSAADAQRSDNYKPTSNANVELAQTNLPIIFMNVNGTEIQREERITAWVKIIDNGEGQLNYGDTVAHPNQTVDFEGYVGLKYRGNSSFTSSDKKPYSFRPFDAPVESGGKKMKAKILGMGKDNDWALLAPFSDKSMIRDVLTFELARPYFDYVPHAKFCELILDGTYYGVYIMSERVGKGKKRLDLHDPGEDGGDLTGDYLVEIDRDDEDNYYQSSYHPFDGDGEEMTSKYTTFQYKHPEYEDFAELPSGTEAALKKTIDDMEASFASEDYTDPSTGYRKYIDVTSFIDYMLSTEFSFNIDGYRLSTNLYKYSDTRAAQEGLDPRWKMSLWDYNIAYANANYYNGWQTNLWQYNFNSRTDDPQSVPFWWHKMLKDDSFVDELEARWQEYRDGAYSDSRLYATIDSLTNLLTSGGAIDRNQEAWGIIGNQVWPNYFNGTTYQEEIDYMTNWIKKRVKFMDRNLLPRDEELETTPVSVSSGWNADLIVEGEPVKSHATNTVDGSLTFFSKSFRDSGGLPTSRELTSPYGVNYCLSDYSADNALLMASTGDSGEVVFDSPFSAKELFFLATSGNGEAAISIVANYTDGTSSDAEEFSIRDWSVANPDGTEAMSGLGRVSLSSGTASSNDHYCLFEDYIITDAARQVKSLTITSTGSARPSVFAFSRRELSSTGIEQPASAAERTVTGIYTVGGVKIPTPQRGLNIIRYSDGTAKKVMVK